MQKARSTVLVVDDDPLSSYTLKIFLEKTHNVWVAEDGATALTLVQSQTFDLIILDVMLPDIDGYNVCREVKSRSLAGGAPIIFISSIDDTKGKLDGFAAGGVDYITKPFVLEEVLSRVATQIDLHHLRRSLEERVQERTRSLEAEIERRRIAESALRKLSTAVIQAPLTVMIVGTNGLIEYVNPSFTSSTGYSYDEVIGKNPRFLKSGYTTLDEYTALWNAITSGEIWRGEFCTVKKNGSRFWESVTLAPVKGDDGQAINFIAIKEDITERKKRDNELLAAKIRAESGSKAKSEFLTLVSHELRTPLNAVIGFSEFMTMELHGPLGDTRYCEYARQVVIAGRHLLHIVEQIIDLTKVEAGKLDIRNNLFEIAPLIDQASTVAAGFKGVKCTNIQKNIVEPLPIMRGDQQLIRQALINIIGNAMTFTPAEGQVNIRVQRGFNNSLEFIITDNGVGIPADNIHRVLEPFEQVENIMTRSHEGLGLGLPLAKLMTEAHGGSLKLESSVGTGTKVTIRIPSERLIEI
jgi:PAS domain S-box-containing protein